MLKDSILKVQPKQAKTTPKKKIKYLCVFLEDFVMLDIGKQKVQSFEKSPWIKSTPCFYEPFKVTHRIY